MKFLLIFLLFAVSVFSQSLSVFPTILSQNGENVILTWENIKNPSKNDAIGVFSPSNSTIPINLVKVSGTSSGNVSVSVVNIRGDYIFKYLSGKSKVESRRKISEIEKISEIIATSQIVTFGFDNMPTNGHLSYYDENPSKMRLMWIDNNKNSEMCKYWLNPIGSSPVMTVMSTVDTYSITDMCTSPANLSTSFRSPGFIHSCILTDLIPGASYGYIYGDVNYEWERKLEFYAAPPPNDNGEMFTKVQIAVFGDMGVAGKFGGKSVAPVYEPANATAYYLTNAVRMGKINLVLLIGDLSYARGQAAQWDQWMYEMQTIVDYVPLHVSIGNHEYDYTGQSFMPKWANYGSDSGGECGVPYSKRFIMPLSSSASPIGRSNGSLWYSFDSGPIHFVIMSCEHDFTQGSQQYDFILNDLMNVNRTLTPFLIFAGHRPMYTSFFRNDAELGEQMIVSLEPLLAKYNVNACFWGHVHMYERTCNMLNWRCDPNGPIHFLVGAGGNTFQVPETEPRPPWSVVRTYNFGFARLVAESPTQLRMEYINDSDGTILDSVYIVG